MNKNQYIEKLARSLADKFPDKGFDCKIVAEEIMNEWLWNQIDSDTSRASDRARDYEYGGTHRHPLDMD